MIETLPDFKAYRALDPTARMQARLTGLAQVIGASGLEVLSDETARNPQAGGLQGLGRGEQAFGEAERVFATKRKSGRPLTEPQVAALATKLDVSPDALQTALDEVLADQGSTDFSA